jgi:DNA polymerase elongation subunit (family B)
VFYYKTLIKTLEKDSRVDQLFNTELSHVQQYLFTKLRIEPTSKVEVQYDKNESGLIDLSKINEDDNPTVAPPSFSILYFEIHTASSYKLGTNDVNNRITQIRVRYQAEPEISLEGNEDIIINDFCKYVLARDPDILVSTNQH